MTPALVGFWESTRLLADYLGKKFDPKSLTVQEELALHRDTLLNTHRVLINDTAGFVDTDDNSYAWRAADQHGRLSQLLAEIANNQNGVKTDGYFSTFAKLADEIVDFHGDWDFTV